MVRGSRLQYANATARWWWLLLGPRGTLGRPLPLQVSVSIVLKGWVLMPLSFNQKVVLNKKSLPFKRKH